ANIVIEPSGQVKILDFGLAKALHNDVAALSIDSTTGQLFGTLHYISPEQARGQPADERSDLFSLGIVFYQMAAGQLPFNALAPHSRSAIGRTVRRTQWPRIVVAGVAVAVIASAIYFVQSGGAGGDTTTTASTAPPAPIRSMAVLPLTNIANNTRDDFLSVG